MAKELLNKVKLQIPAGRGQERGGRHHLGEGGSAHPQALRQSHQSLSHRYSLTRKQSKKTKAYENNLFVF